MGRDHSPQTNIDALLQEYRVSLREIARQADVDVSSVEAALDSRWLSRCPIIVLIKVRATLEALLCERGWQGDRQAVWGDLDTLLAELEAEQQRCRLH